MILGREKILEYVGKGIIEIEPFDENNVGPASVDLTLDRFFRVFDEGFVELKDDSFDPSSHGKLVEAEYIDLNPGDFVLGVTRERIRLPSNIMGRLTGRSRFARIGLMVHVSSTLVHPGSNNKQVLEIVNLGAKRIRLHAGVKIAQIVFEEVEGGSTFTGRYQHQTLP